MDAGGEAPTPIIAVRTFETSINVRRDICDNDVPTALKSNQWYLQNHYEK